jgi:hypothetical protein
MVHVQSRDNTTHGLRQIVRKYRPQNDHVEGSDLAKRFFIARWERERAERAK